MSLQLVDGVLADTRLSKATAAAALNQAQQLSVEVEVAPADHQGHVKISGQVLLPMLPTGSGRSSSSGGQGGGTAAKHDSATASGTVAAGAGGGTGRSRKRKHKQAGAEDAGSSRSSKSPTSSTSHAGVDGVDMQLLVKDGGMSLLASLAPGVTWEGGSCSASFRVAGPLMAPRLTGNASLSKASVAAQVLRHPITHLGGSFKVDGQQLIVPGMEAKVGPKGSLHIAGEIPLQPSMAAVAAVKKGSSSSSGLQVQLSGIELRVRNMYTGGLDAEIGVQGSLQAPSLGGKVVLSRGTAFLLPQGAAGPNEGAAGAGGAGTTGASAGGAAGGAVSSRESSEGEMVAAAFAALKAGRQRAQDPGMIGSSSYYSRQMTPFGAAGAGAADAPAAPPELMLSGLQLELGPELRALFPVVLNVGVQGRLVLNGAPAGPGGVVPSGVLRLENGVLNLVATQFRLDREHPNTLTFTPEAGGLDPVLDLSLVSADLRASISGRSSAWKEHLTLSVPGGPGGAAAGGGGGGGGGGGPGEALGDAEVARVFEGRLADSLLAEDGSLSLSTLATNTFSSLLPKIETQGQLGKAR